MALAGQGDPRWIVRDLGKEGKNVGNWHWTERDITAWARDRLCALFLAEPIGSLAVGEGAIEFRVAGQPSVSGDCTLYNRKGKLRAIYDLKVSADWEARSFADKAVRGKGSFELELFDENPDVTVTSDRTLDQGGQFVAFMNQEGRSWVQRCIQRFLDEALQQGNADEVPRAAPSDAAFKPMEKKIDAPMSVVSDGTNEEKSAVSLPSSWAELRLEERFAAPASLLFKVLTTVEGLQRITRAPATSDPTAPKGTFSLYGGQVHGFYTRLVEPEILEQHWRMADWEPKDHFSLVHIRLVPMNSGETRLELIQEQIPEEHLERTRVGWKERIFDRLRLVFNLGGMSLQG
ncbi:AHA1, activator of heat shock 90kDa protein ATPase [Cyanidiococcus yangmingshanensis]|uniref:AHA1, activator of heat shock 90kDa protein ATPase n=1 Tax=Cyanidiococcus yangmingshanensis TaxID=2690220 RepID=A0A7J7IPH8_9RHOD|nr:AHA1, activator of heat shock 90kDa protein ATPase [Cyanidiococcus yangmingshanensis]